MKNGIQTGDTLSLPAPYDRNSGQGALIGNFFGVAQFTVANGAAGEWAMRGVFDLDKAGSQAWTVGALIYWDNTAKNCTTTSSGNKLIGAAALAAGSADVVGRVRLNGVTVT